MKKRAEWPSFFVRYIKACAGTVYKKGSRSFYKCRRTRYNKEKTLG